MLCDVFSERSREAFSSKIEKNIKRKKKNDEDKSNNEEEIENEKKLQRAVNFQSRNAKNKMKPKKLNAMSNFDQGLLRINKFTKKTINNCFLHFQIVV